jgi:predicted anti-sigma-YlaC factor YlaD
MQLIHCKEVRDQLMYYMDNELPTLIKDKLIGHLKNCSSCLDYFNEEKQIKSKICNKLKDAYICRCNVEKLEQDIKKKIGEICYKKEE